MSRRGEASMSASGVLRNAIAAPQTGKTLVVFAFCYCLAAALLWYRVEPNWFNAIPACVSALPLAARTLRTGIALRITAAVLLLLFVAFSLMGVGGTFIPAAVAMYIAGGRALNSEEAVQGP